MGEFERWSKAPPAAFLSAETDLLALIDDAIAGWRASLEAMRGSMPRLALVTAEWR